MLINFSFNNYRSFKDKCEFSMIGVKSFKEHEETHLVKINEKMKLLKSAVIYGNNASGKTNFLMALGYLRLKVITSFKDSLEEAGQMRANHAPFALNTETIEAPSSFEIEFIANGIRFRYGFEIFRRTILKEWLFQTQKTEVNLFKREGQLIHLNKSSFKEGVGLEKNLRPDALFLSLVAQMNGVVSNVVLSWFVKLNTMTSVNDRLYDSYTHEKLATDGHFKSWVTRIANSLEISNISAEEDNSESENDKDSKKTHKPNTITTWHRQFDKDNVLVDTIAFNFETNESEGTKKLINLLGPWYDSLRNSRVLVIDELDSRLHPLILKSLIDLFHEHNRNNAQLIFTTHDTSCLNKDTFRRDQVWFVDKNQFGSSEMYSLADFKAEKVRKTTDFERKYTEGLYGAISYWKPDIETITDLYGNGQ